MNSMSFSEHNCAGSEGLLAPHPQQGPNEVIVGCAVPWWRCPKHPKPFEVSGGGTADDTGTNLNVWCQEKIGNEKGDTATTPPEKVKF